LKSSSRLLALYVFVSWIWKHVALQMYEDRRVSDCFPEPPTPTSSAQPRERPKRRVMRVRCSRASWKNTSSMRSSLYASLNFSM
jgi:hypothetical protein